MIVIRNWNLYPNKIDNFKHRVVVIIGRDHRGDFVYYNSIIYISFLCKFLKVAGEKKDYGNRCQSKRAQDEEREREFKCHFHIFFKN